MRNLLRSRRGSAAFATVIALVPLIGVVALGGEAGSWYVTKQSAQNAADGAAYSGALTLACKLANNGTCSIDTQTVAYRGKEFAAQNTFCNAGDATAYPGRQCAASLPTGVSQAVAIDIGDYSAGTFTTPPAGNGNAVRAKVSQQQPPYLSKLLGLTTITIPTQAIALVEKPNDVCGLGLGRYVGSGSPQSSLTLGGSLSSGGTGCGLMSDNKVNLNSTPSFGGSSWALYGVTGCGPGTCPNPGVTHNYFSPYATNPLSILDSESFNSATTSHPGSPCSPSCTITPNTPTTAYGNLTVNSSKTATFTSGGTYFFYNATINVTGGGALNGANVNIVLLGNSSISISGSANLSANTANASYPDLNGVLFDDQAPNRSSNAVTINGSGTIKLGGAMYFPNVDVTLNGTAQNINNTCAELIANSITMTGSAYLSSAGCPSNVVPKTQVVALVQ
jgi:Flp pilus assembly protein TadG